MEPGTRNTVSSAALHDNASLHVGNIYNYASTPNGDVSARKAAVLGKLPTSPYRDRKNRNPERVQGTCEWFRAHTLFRQWKAGTTSSFLWVSADPGCGKSVLAKFLVDEELPTSAAADTMICYFFFKDDFEDQRSAKSALRCILHQVLCGNEALFTDQVLKRFEANGDFLLGSVRELWDLLVDISCQAGVGEIICILDAYDECAQDERDELTKSLYRFYQKRNPKSRLKILVTSRPYDDIALGFKGVDPVHLAGEDEEELHKIRREIDLVIQAETANIGRDLSLEPDEEDMLRDQLCQVPHHTYIWVHLTLDTIRKDLYINKRKIGEIALKLPGSVDEAYEKILSRSSNEDEARRLLYAVVAAARPLTLIEMAVVLGIGEHHRSFAEIETMPPERFRNYLRDLCGLFITVIDSKIFLLHQTAREFLVSPKTVTAQHPSGNKNTLGSWKHSVAAKDSHHLLAQVCIWYLLLPESEVPRRPVGNKNVDQLPPEHVLLDYAAKNWYAHYQASDLEDEGNLLKICGWPADDPEGVPPWFQVYWSTTHEGFPAGFSPLMIAAYCGVLPAARTLLRQHVKGAVVWKRDDTFLRSALSWAAGAGHCEIVRLIVGEPIDRFHPLKMVDKLRGNSNTHDDRGGRPPLAHAALNGHAKVVEVLLKVGAKVHTRDHIGGTPLSYGLLSGDPATAELLMSAARDGGLSASRITDELEDLMFSAIIKKDKRVVELLLDSGRISPNTTPGRHHLTRTFPALFGAWRKISAAPRTMLHLAVSTGAESIVELLLDRGADVDEVDSAHGLTALHWAAVSADLTTLGLLDLLFDRNATAHPKAHEGLTPFDACSTVGHARRLIDRGGLPHEHQALSRAAMSGSARDLGLLLTERILEDEKLLWRLRLLSLIQGNTSATAAAALLDEISGVRIAGFGVGFPVPVGQSMLELAIQDDDIVQRRMNVAQLLQNVASLKPGHLSRPLYLAARTMDDAALTQLLLDHGGNPNLRIKHNEGLGSSLLGLCARRSSLDVLAVLLSSGADVDVSDLITRHTALYHAVDTGRKDHVKMLLDHGADPERPDHEGRTPAHRAADLYHNREIYELVFGKQSEAENHTESTPSSNAQGPRKPRSRVDQFKSWAQNRFDTAL